jgi:hypothetical protein
MTWKPIDSAPQPGDTFTIAHIYRMIPNPDRKWWQVWKPRKVCSREPETWTVVSANMGGTAAVDSNGVWQWWMNPAPPHDTKTNWTTLLPRLYHTQPDTLADSDGDDGA